MGERWLLMMRGPLFWPPLGVVYRFNNVIKSGFSSKHVETRSGACVKLLIGCHMDLFWNFVNEANNSPLSPSMNIHIMHRLYKFFCGFHFEK